MGNSILMYKIIKEICTKVIKSPKIMKKFIKTIMKQSHICYIFKLNFKKYSKCRNILLKRKLNW